MSEMPQNRRVRIAFIVAVAAILMSLWVVLFRVDLTPKVESDFFFSTDDPAFQASKRIEQTFPTRPQLLISAEGGDILSDEYIGRIGKLTDALTGVEGVRDVRSLTHGPSTPEATKESPLWRRLLLTDNPNASQLVAFVDDEAGGELITRVEEILAAHDRPDFSLEISGVPYVVELIRRHLQRDLRVFSFAAFLVFGLVILVVYRSWPLVVGTLLACLGACFVTLTVLHLLGTPIGILTANIATIVFVLTLSHTVFLSANWRRARRELDAEEAVARGVRITFTASFWCMVAALLGFGSLLLATAKPLRELGTSGVVGTTVAIVVAYSFYPFFLRFGTVPEKKSFLYDAEPRLPGPVTTMVVVAACAVAAFGLPRLNTDPSILSYFAKGGDLRTGLELIDRNGGSIPLYLVVADPGGKRLDTGELQESLDDVQESIEKEPSVGVSLSLPVLVAEAKQNPLARFMKVDQIVDILEGERYDRIARSFLSENRTQALFFLRMRESDRAGTRQETVARLREKIEEAGLELRLVGGLYDLQAKLGELVSASLGRELGGLLLFFVFVAAAVSRSPRVALAMVACLAAVPLILLGTIGQIRQAVDVISAPAANVAISLGIDAMIHLVMAVRRRKSAGDDELTSWATAAVQMRPPVVGAMSILALGFGIFVLSSFPPTRRFGTIVALGSLLSAVMALQVLPWIATWHRKDLPASKA